ncbi:hypothetical protein [Streptomyces roseoverticillatus]|uniref:hypothetical protein n=1 Tax=Streptomyces roseoverticillatus TaxID=66429 RepID=UPI000694FD16|nr:hypothetical protein [Streptomyces roseoverticillatus]
MPEDRLRGLLDSVTYKGARFFGADLTGLQLRADELNWPFSTGATLTGPVQDLLLFAFGRRLPEGRLKGAVPRADAAG